MIKQQLIALRGRSYKEVTSKFIPKCIKDLKQKFMNKYKEEKV